MTLLFIRRIISLPFVPSLFRGTYAYRHSSLDPMRSPSQCAVVHLLFSHSSHLVWVPCRCHVDRRYRSTPLWTSVVCWLGYDQSGLPDLRLSVFCSCPLHLFTKVFFSQFPPPPSVCSLGSVPALRTHPRFLHPTLPAFRTFMFSLLTPRLCALGSILFGRHFFGSIFLCSSLFLSITTLSMNLSQTCVCVWISTLVQERLAVGE